MFAAAKAPSGSVTFEKDVRPILKAHCFHCHGEEGETKGGLDVRLARFLMKGGESGPAVVPGQAASSHILKQLKNGEMPKGKPPLKAAEIAAIEKWIAAGAPTARPEPEKLGPEHAFTDEERAWWAFQAIQRPKVPEVAKGQESKINGENSIDAFLKEKLDKAGLAFSSQADRATLIRRATYDLTGLPPTPAEVDAFVNDDSLLAWEKVIERLLASPHYGERWGRHWLDVAGYADSDGYTEKDTERPWAWKFRDYVIASFNEDKPFDQFIREQLAGDEMVKQPYRNLDAGSIEKLAATGFLRMAPDGSAVQNDKATQNATIADTIKIVGTSLYGMTIACAQCHDHRYDPISQADYYRLRAVFEPGFDTKNWRAPAGRLVSLLTESERAEAAKIESEAKKLDDVRLKKQEEFITEVLEKELLKADEGSRDALRTAYRTTVKDRKPEQVKLLKAWPRVNQLSGGSLYLYDTTYKTKYADTLKKMAEEAAAVRATKPKEEFVQAFTEVPKAAAAVPATFIFHRGDHEQPKEKVPPSDLTVLAGLRKVEVPEKSTTLPTTGRRLAFAQSLTDGKHPLLARVLVNRAWMHHFGKGIVTSAGDFGALGQKPTHPELLDWLASEFMAQGWSMKKLHRLIMTSEAYRQASTRDANKERIDPDNALLSRMNVRRLEAESLRDSMLAVSGKLAPAISGKPVPVMANEEGQVVIGQDATDTAGRPSGKIIPLHGEEFRRSVYVQVRRSKPLGMLETFDAPTMVEPNCSERPSTTVSPQSLMLMNSGYMREYAQYFAMRLQKESAGDVKGQVSLAFRLAYGRVPQEADVAAGMKFVEEQVAFYKTHPAPLEYAVGAPSKENADPALLGLAALCHALMSANEFLYVD